MAYQWCLTIMICFWLDVLNRQLSKILCVRLLGVMRLQEFLIFFPKHALHRNFSMSCASSSFYFCEEESESSTWIPIKQLKFILVSALILDNLAPIKSFWLLWEFKCNDRYDRLARVPGCSGVMQKVSSCDLGPLKNQLWEPLLLGKELEEAFERESWTRLFIFTLGRWRKVKQYAKDHNDIVPVLGNT